MTNDPVIIALDVNEPGYSCTLADLVAQRVRLAVQVGVDGIVGSPLEPRTIRAEVTRSACPPAALTHIHAGLQGHR
jgi:hypothetical protein